MKFTCLFHLSFHMNGLYWPNSKWSVITHFRCHTRNKTSLGMVWWIFISNMQELRVAGIANNKLCQKTKIILGTGPRWGHNKNFTFQAIGWVTIWVCLLFETVGIKSQIKLTCWFSSMNFMVISIKLDYKSAIMRSSPIAA